MKRMVLCLIVLAFGNMDAEGACKRPLKTFVQNVRERRQAETSPAPAKVKSTKLLGVSLNGCTNGKCSR